MEGDWREEMEGGRVEGGGRRGEERERGGREGGREVGGRGWRKGEQRDRKSVV